VSVVVINVSTAHSMARAVVKGKPMTHRVVSVTGGGIAEPANLLVPVGSLLSDVVEACGGVADRAAKVLAGGPMMGATLPNLEIPVTKGVGGITVMTADETAHWHESACMRCGRCITNCPLYLPPTKIAHAIKHRDYDLAVKFNMNACCECGCCSYVCPAEIPLAQYIRAGKNQLRLINAQKKEKEQAPKK
jgi:electron transport complex protein RnfC